MYNDVWGCAEILPQDLIPASNKPQKETEISAVIHHNEETVCDACDERGNFEGCRYACFLSVADVGLFYRS